MSGLTLRPARTMWEKACTATGSVASKKMVVARPIARPGAPNRGMFDLVQFFGRSSRSAGICLMWPAARDA